MSGNDRARAAALTQVQADIAYDFTDAALLDRALTHASVSGVKANVRHNERLEFLGDRVLGLLTAEHLIAVHPDEREGDLSKRLHALVDRSACARVGRRLGLAASIRRSAVSVEKAGQAADTVLADAAEALLAAVYLDGGLDAAREVFARAWAEELADTGPVAVNPKVALQEALMKRGEALPRYEVVEMTGPAHAPKILVRLTAGDREPVTASGRSRQDAEKAAAVILLELISL